MKSIFASCALIALTSAVSTSGFKKTSNLLAQNQCSGLGSGDYDNNRHCRREKVDYDYECLEDREEHDLRNEITLYGPKVVLINLDDRHQIRKLEREGVFV